MYMKPSSLAKLYLESTYDIHHRYAFSSLDFLPSNRQSFHNSSTTNSRIGATRIYITTTRRQIRSYPEGIQNMMHIVLMAMICGCATKTIFTQAITLSLAIGLLIYNIASLP